MTFNLNCFLLFIRSGYVKLRFNPSQVEDSESRLSFVIFTNTTSQELEPQGEVIAMANVVKRAEISIKGYGIVILLLFHFSFSLCHKIGTIENIVLSLVLVDQNKSFLVAMCDPLLSTATKLVNRCCTATKFITPDRGRFHICL